MKDIAESLHRAMYGKTGNVNAAENDNPEFQAGYAVGMKADAGRELIEPEFIRRGRVYSDGFHEWKRGMWAGVMQRTTAKLED